MAHHVERRRSPDALTDGARKAKVAELDHAVPRDEHVFRLDVAVEYLFVVVDGGVSRPGVSGCALKTWSGGCDHETHVL